MYVKKQSFYILKRAFVFTFMHIGFYKSKYLRKQSSSQTVKPDTGCSCSELVSASHNYNNAEISKTCDVYT